ncbi:MAG: DUF4249 family protein [Marinilabiliaceae bacterium]
MEKRTHKLTILLAVIALMACTQNVDLEQPAYQEQIVVDGYIETGQPARIYLTMSSPYLTHYDSASIRESFLNYAKITLTSSRGEEEILTLFREEGFFPPFVYKSLSVKGETGVRYDIKVEVKGKVIEASTTIPPPPDIADTRLLPATDSSGYVEYAVDPASEEMYLFTRVASRLAGEKLHPSYDPVAVVDPDAESPHWQRLLRSREHGLYLIDTSSDVYEGWPRFHYSLHDTVEIAVGTVDSVSYNVIRSLFYDRSNHENPFAFRQEDIRSNIEGGLGRWTGIGITDTYEVRGQSKASEGSSE